jgi:hypothetical protein
MKAKLNTIILLLFSISGFSQVEFPRNKETDQIEFVRVIQLDSIPKKDIFYKSKLWVVELFKSANDVIQYENIEDGKIVGKGNFKIVSTGLGLNGTIHPNSAGIVSFSFEITSKDNKCRIRIFDFTHTAKMGGGKIDNERPDCGTFNLPMKSWHTIQQTAIDETKSILQSFDSNMKKSVSNKDEW